uniref:(northern house mosquito) hypothetical protein n=1 Tax=Culex pipiens TaxID=7175 RepID=A0A8D8N0G5_CULPI
MSWSWARPGCRMIEPVYLALMGTNPYFPAGVNRMGDLQFSTEMTLTLTSAVTQFRTACTTFIFDCAEGSRLICMQSIDHRVLRRRDLFLRSSAFCPVTTMDMTA